MGAVLMHIGATLNVLGNNFEEWEPSSFFLKSCKKDFSAFSLVLFFSPFECSYQSNLSLLFSVYLYFILHTKMAVKMTACFYLHLTAPLTWPTAYLADCCMSKWFEISLLFHISATCVACVLQQHIDSTDIYRHLAKRSVKVSLLIFVWCLTLYH